MSENINSEVEELEEKDKPIIGWNGENTVSNDAVSKENSIGRTLKMVGILTLFVGVITGLIVGATLSTPMAGYETLTTPSPLRWVYGFTIIISSFVSGLVFMGLGEVILLLNEIKVKISK